MEYDMISTNINIYPSAAKGKRVGMSPNYNIIENSTNNNTGHNKLTLYLVLSLSPFLTLGQFELKTLTLLLFYFFV